MPIRSVSVARKSRSHQDAQHRNHTTPLRTQHEPQTQQKNTTKKQAVFFSDPIMSSQGDDKTIFPCGTPTTRLVSPKRGCGINQVSVAASPKGHRVPRTYEYQRFLTDREVERARALFLERGGIPADQDPVSALSTLFQNLQLTAPPSTTELRSYLNTLRASSHNHRVEEEVKVPTDVIDVQTFVDILNVHKRHFLRQKHKNDEVWAAFVNLREESLSKCSEEVEGEDGTNEVEDDMNVASARHHGKNSVSLHRMQEIMNLYGLTFNVYDFYHKACIHPSDKVDFEAFRYCCGAEDLDTVALFRRLGGHEDFSGSIPAVRFAHEHPYLACLDSEMRCSLLTSLGAPLEGQFDYHDVCAISIRLRKEAKKHAKFLHQQNALESDSTLNSQMNPKEPFGQSTKQNTQRCEEQNQQSLVPLQEAEPSLTHDEFSGSFHPSFPDDTSLLLPDSRTQNDFTSYDRENLTQMNPSHFREGGPSTPRDLQRRHLGSRMSGSISWNTLATSNFNYNTSSPTTNRLLSRLEQIDSESTMYRSRIRKHAPLTAEVRRRSSRFLHLATRKGLTRSWNGVEDERHLQENVYEHGESHVQDMASRHVNLHMQSVPRRPWPARAPHSAQFYRSAPRSQSLLTDSFEVNIRAGASLRQKTQYDNLYCSILGHEEFIQTMRKYPNIGAHID